MTSVLYRVFESTSGVVARFERNVEWEELLQAVDDLLDRFKRSRSEKLLLNVAQIELWSGRYHQIARLALDMRQTGKNLQLCGFDASDQAFLDLTRLRGIAEAFDTEEEARSTWSSNDELNEVACWPVSARNTVTETEDTTTVSELDASEVTNALRSYPLDPSLGTAKRDGDTVIIDVTCSPLMEPQHVSELSLLSRQLCRDHSIQRFVVDLCGVDIISGSALSAIVKLLGHPNNSENLKARRTGFVTVCADSQYVLEVFAVTKIEQLARLCGSLNEALATLADVSLAR